MQINNITHQPEIFSQFPKYDLNSGINSNNQALGTDSAALDNKNKKQSRTKKILFGSTVASTVLTAGIAAMVLAKGFHGSNLTKLKPNILNEVNSIDKTVIETKKATHKAVCVMESFSNFTAIKDWTADKVLRSTKFGAKFADSAKGKFQEIINKTLGKKYDKAGMKVKDMSSLLRNFDIKNLMQTDEAQMAQEITIKEKTMPLSEWIKELFVQSGNLESSFNEGFSAGARKLRDKKRSKLLEGTRDKIKGRFFKNRCSLFKVKNYKGYVTENVTAEARRDIAKDILSAKKKVTNNISAIHTNSIDLVENFKQNINCKDDKTLEYVREIKSQLEAFKNCSGADETSARKAITDNITGIIGKTAEEIEQSNLYTSEKRKELIRMLEKLKSSVNAVDEKGALEEIMTILNGLNKSGVKCGGKPIISDAQLKEYSKLSDSIVKELKSASDLEAGEYFMKRAEIEVGSAPTDVLSLLFPIGAGAYAVGKCDDKDEKVSAVLTTCLPLVGTFAVFIYGTTKMMYGVKNLALSAVSGLALNKLGNYCDKLYKNYKNSGSVVEVAKGEYDTLKQDLKFDKTGENS